MYRQTHWSPGNNLLPHLNLEFLTGGSSKKTPRTKSIEREEECKKLQKAPKNIISISEKLNRRALTPLAAKSGPSPFRSNLPRNSAIIKTTAQSLHACSPRLSEQKNSSSRCRRRTRNLTRFLQTYWEGNEAEERMTLTLSLSLWRVLSPICSALRWKAELQRSRLYEAEGLLAARTARQLGGAARHS